MLLSETARHSIAGVAGDRSGAGWGDTAGGHMTLASVSWHTAVMETLAF